MGLVLARSVARNAPRYGSILLNPARYFLVPRGFRAISSDIEQEPETLEETWSILLENAHPSSKVLETTFAIWCSILLVIARSGP